MYGHRCARFSLRNTMVKKSIYLLSYAIIFLLTSSAQATSASLTNNTDGTLEVKFIYKNITLNRMETSTHTLLQGEKLTYENTQDRRLQLIEFFSISGAAKGKKGTIMTGFQDNHTININNGADLSYTV